MIGLILAGGQSRRMGRDKAALTIANTTWIEHLTTLLSQCGCRPVLHSVACPGTRPECELIDDQSDLGPLGGWVTVARRFPQESIMSVPVDMPALQPDVIRQLMEGEGSSWARSGQDDHWLLARVAVADLNACIEFVAGGGRSAASFWKTRRTVTARVFEDSGAFLNVNCPDDLGRLDGV